MHPLSNRKAKGEMLEWLKRHAWKACIRQKRIGGSNPPLSATSHVSRKIYMTFFYSISIFSLVFFLWFASLFHVSLQLSYRTWTTSILKQYFANGYVINEKWHDYTPIRTIDIDGKNGTKGEKDECYLAATKILRGKSIVIAS